MEIDEMMNGTRRTRAIPIKIDEICIKNDEIYI